MNDLSIKIAVNITTDVSDYSELVETVYKFLGTSNVILHLYSCNKNNKNITQNEYPNQKTTLFKSNSIIEDTNLASVSNRKNTIICNKSAAYLRHNYRSYINAIKMHDNIFDHRYSFVINYHDVIQNFKKLMTSSIKDFEMGYVFAPHIITPTVDNYDYRFYLCSQSDFFKLVNSWRFITFEDDDTFLIWKWFAAADDIGGHIFRRWCGMQHIKLRLVNGL